MIWSCNRRAGKGIAARVPKVLWSSVGVNNSRTSVHATKPDHHWLFHTHRNPRRHELCAPLPNGRRYSRCGYYHRSLHRPALATAERPYLNPYVTCDCRAATEMMERGMKLVVDVPDRVRRRGLSLHRHGSGGGGGGTGCECENKLSASFPTFRSVSAGSWVAAWPGTSGVQGCSQGSALELLEETTYYYNKPRLEIAASAWLAKETNDMKIVVEY